MQESYLIYDRNSLVKPFFICEFNKFLPIYYSVSNFSKKKKKNLKLFQQQIKKYLYQIAKVSKKKVETTDQKVHSFQLTKSGKKRKARMATIDFISMRGQQNFEDDAEINPIEIKIENYKIQNMFEKYKRNPIKFTLEGLLFSSAIKNDTEKIFVTTSGSIEAKYGLINGKLYQTIGVINLNEIKNWNEIKKFSRGVNVNFQVQGDDRDAKHFSYNFITKNTGDVLNFMLKLIDDENKKIKFEDKEKKFPIVNFLLEKKAKNQRTIH